MSHNEDMTIDERRKCLRTMKKRYLKANRKTKGRLLDEMEAVTGLDRLLHELPCVLQHFRPGQPQ